jgi:hypothetical protein
MPPEPPAQGRIEAVFARTRARHTRERATVERMILRQLEEQGWKYRSAHPEVHA